MAVFLEHKLRLQNFIWCNVHIYDFVSGKKELFAVKFAAEGAMCHITPFNWKKSAAFVNVI